ESGDGPPGRPVDPQPPRSPGRRARSLRRRPDGGRAIPPALGRGGRAAPRMTGSPPITEALRRSAAYLAAHGVEGPMQTAETLLMHVLGTDRTGLYARRDGLDTSAARLFGRALCQRCTGTPVQYLTGEQQFMNLVLSVSPGVFVPRPETEGLVEVALEA